jgi:hypothetical protein
MHAVRSISVMLFFAFVPLLDWYSRGAGRGPVFDLGVVTEAPITIGGQATVELPHGILLQGELGVMPGFYTDAIGAVLTAAGANASIATPLLHAGLDGSLVTGISAGWRPFRYRGLEILGGYTMMSLGGTTDAGTIVEESRSVGVGSSASTSSSALRSAVSRRWHRLRTWKSLQ